MIQRRQIRKFAEAVAQTFRPHKIILFGSYAYGKPTEDSDVDLLIVMNRTRVRGERMSVRIRRRIPAGFPLDLLVRTPKFIAQRMAWEDCFTQEILTKGKVLYEAGHAVGT
ncbi:MAG: nucleotidyltransferase domain-containing protein [Verrucomicrobia bacterium]|nr:nucleotidyltransferase domain-containing protein [Verrucomicrobiota bacterium]